MIPTPTEMALLNEYRQERRVIVARLKHIDTWMAQFASQIEAFPEPEAPAKGSNAKEETMPFTIRHAIRAYLRDAGVSKTAPEIAKAMLEHGFFPTYKKTKSNVDSTLSRMVGKELQKNRDGRYEIKKTEDNAIAA